MSTDTTSDAQRLHDDALAAFQAGQFADAHELMRRALLAETELEWLNDLAVLSHELGRRDLAETLLRAVLAIEPERPDALDNVAALAEAIASENWRDSDTLGGSDSQMYERAFPGMPRPDVMSEHASRYAFAQGFVGGRDVLDLGCGTGYGSEMLSWSARSVRGFDLWRPAHHEEPRWPGVDSLTYGHDLCADPLPVAEIAVMFEVIEHLPDAPRALRIAWGAVDVIVGSFPNPVHHGSWMNQYHVNDWTLAQFERELRDAASDRFTAVDLTHFHQPVGSPLLAEGRDPDASFWIVVARGAFR